MKKVRKYKDSQILWLAENLTNDQVLYLLEAETPAQGGSPIAQQPVAPAQNQAPQQPQQNTQQSQQPSAQAPQQPQKNNNVNTIIKAIAGGKLANIEASQLKSFADKLNMTTKDFGQALSKIWGYLSKAVKTKNAGNIFKSIGTCLDFLKTSQQATAKQVVESAKALGVDVNNLAGNIKSKNNTLVYLAGQYAMNESYVNDINKIKASIKNFKTAHKSNSNSLLESAEYFINEAQNNTIKNTIDTYYNINKDIKKFLVEGEKAGVDMQQYHDILNKDNKLNKFVNESLSAIKYAIAYYNSNKE
jgi:hypothetical protein